MKLIQDCISSFFSPVSHFDHRKKTRHQCWTHHTTCKADAPQPRAYVVPHPDAAPADTLTHCKLQEEQRDANQYEQDQIGHQVRSCQSEQYRRRVR